MTRRLVIALALVGAVACTSTPSGAPAPTGTSPVGAAPTPAPTVATAGTVRVAYPEEPGAWHPALTGEAAAVDLTALWGLPLYRIDGAGDLRPGLVRYARVLAGDPWAVEVGLRPGRWSDGRPVVGADVAATLEALRVTPAGPGLEPLVDVQVTDARTVRLRFDRPYGRWQHVLAGVGGVLPAHVLEEAGLEAFRSGVPVAGGSYRLASHERGLRAVFEANPGGPLGAPRTRRLEVLFVPSYETALGLLRDGRVDIALGHLALNPVQRAMRIEGMDAAAPLGGTWVGLRWRPGGPVGGDGARPTRTAMRSAGGADQIVQGLLGQFGEVAKATVPGVDGPWGGAPAVDGGEPPDAVTLLVPRWQEATSLTGRALRQGLEAVGTDVQLVALEPDRLAAVLDERGDGALVVRRDGPRPSLLARGPQVLASVLAAADAATQRDGPAASAAQRALFEEAGTMPLFRIGVAHVWSTAMRGVEPSSWPGLALWAAERWTAVEGGRAADVA